MEVFDKVTQLTIDRRDRQLSILAVLMVIILGGGMALLMYPMVFGKTAVIQVAPSRTLFFGFCALCLLMVAYLVNRMFVVHNLRSSLIEEIIVVAKAVSVTGRPKAWRELRDFFKATFSSC